MIFFQSQTLKTLPILILMPHSACNCRCLMCDIWKSNTHARTWNSDAFEKLKKDIRTLHVREVVFSGGEALLHPGLFEFCAALKTNKGIKLTLLSTGLLLERFSTSITEYFDEVIISLDGPEPIHDTIRNISGGFEKINKGVKNILNAKPTFNVSARCVVQKSNFRFLKELIVAAQNMGLKRLSFLPADTHSQAFNHTSLPPEQTIQIIPSQNELPELRFCLRDIITKFESAFHTRWISESPEKLMRIADYYEAFYGIRSFNSPPCNAPWVSAVVESDGSVRPCFFHEPIGNFFNGTLHEILNSESAIQFRKQLDIQQNSVCQRCVCSLKYSKSIINKLKFY